MSNRLTRKHGALTAGLCAIILPFMLCAAAQAETLYFHRGHLGSAELVSNAAGEIVARNLFQPYGVPTTIGSETDANPYARFTGKRQDSATGLYYFGARYYDAGLGRFLSPDPARQIPSPYAYAGGAPLSNVDPDGRVFTPAQLELLEALTTGRLKRMEPDGPPRKVKLSDFMWVSFIRHGKSENLIWDASAEGEMEASFLDLKEKGAWSTSDPRQHRDTYNSLKEDFKELKRDYEKISQRYRDLARESDDKYEHYRRQLGENDKTKREAVTEETNLDPKGTYLRRLARNSLKNRSRWSREQEHYDSVAYWCKWVIFDCKLKIERTFVDDAGNVRWSY